MNDPSKTDQELLEEISALRRRIKDLEWSKSEIIFRELSKQSLVGVYLMQQDGLLRYVNPRCAEIFGYRVEDVIDRLRVNDVILSEDWPTVRESLIKRISGELPSRHYEFRIVTKDQDIKHVEAYSSYTEYEGEPAIVGTLVDITERKRAEEALKENEKKYRLLADNTADVIFTFGLDMKYRYISPSVSKIRGFSPEEIIGQPISRSMTAQSVESVKRVVREELELDKAKTADPNRTRIVEVELYCKDGSTIWTEVKTSAVRNSKGEAVEVIGIARDITERKQMEEALRGSELRLSQAIELAEIVYWEFDLAQEVYTFNDPFYAFHGTTAEQEGGYRMKRGEYRRRFVHPDDQLPVYQAVQHVIAGYDSGFLAPIEHRIVRRDGEVRHIVVRATNARDDSGRIIKRYGIAQDITERKRAEERILRLNRELRAITNCNQTLLRAKDEQTLLTDICRIICDEAGYRMAWVGYAEKDGEKSVRPIAWAGAEDDYLSDAHVTWADVERGRGPTGTSIRSAQPVYTQDFATDGKVLPWRERALSRGYRCAIALPLKDEKGEAFGALTIYSGVAGSFTPDEITLLEELTGDLAYGITFLRMQAERAKMTKELAESRAQTLAIVNSTDDRIWSVDAESFRVLTWNRAFEDFFRVERGLEPKVGMGLDELWQSESRVIEKWQSFYRKGLVEAPCTIEDVTFTGNVRQMNFNLLKQDGRTLGISIFSRDITRRKKAEEALRMSELRLSQAMELANVVYWEFDPAENVFILNDPFYALYGTTAEREGGYRMEVEEYRKRFIHPDDQLFVSRAVRENIARGTAESMPDIEHRIIRRDGEVRHIVVRATATTEDSGRVIMRYGINQDITDRKQAQTELSQSEKRYRAVFENTGAATVIIENDTTISLCNVEFEHLSGYPKNEVEGKKSWMEFVFKDDQGNMLSFHHLRRKSPDATSKQYGFRFVTKAGEVRDVYVVVDVIPGTDRSVASLVDITDLKRAEQEKTHLETQLHQAQKMEAIGTLAGGIAHDFNNILTALVGYATLLQMEAKRGKSRDYADQILAASQKAAELVQNLLAFSRQQRIRLEPVSLHEIVRGTEKLLKRLVTEDIAVNAHLEGQDIVIMADATQIDQILFNLATNARDAMPQGGTFTIETQLIDLDDEFQRLHGYGKPGCYALLAVSDTGMGMDEATKERIFDPFFTTKGAGKGTGLGLSTVYGIVKQHDGYITVYSEPHVGTTFHIYLPTAKETLREDQPKPASVKGGNEIILIGEDNEAVRELIDKILTHYGYTTLKAVDGQDAVEQFKKADKVHLLILDSVMPKKNGREAYNEILALKPGVKVIFISGHTRDVVLDKGIQDGEFSFLQKPISPITLLQKVREVLDSGLYP
ncbi:MAG TPA: PAS domain S-box protein [Syntrophorhabdaceae bacterium]|nr:PAS domain S-box protein [Syntrophorhabdaceae bacterium]